MKYLLLLLLSIGTCLFAVGQEDPIRIVLIGTVHFEPSQVDLYANEELDIGSKKRQAELEHVARSIASFGTDKICVESPTSSQTFIDSLYSAYLDGTRTLAKDEVEQVAFRSAARCELAEVSCINYSGQFYIDSVFEYALSHGQEQIVQDINTWGGLFMEEIDTNLQSLSITNFLLYLNSEECLSRNAQLYSQFLARVGHGDNYLGIDLLSEWYTTNLHIYANLLRSIKPSDKEVVVVFGQGHLPILRHLIQHNPTFELVELEEILD